MEYEKNILDLVKQYGAAIRDRDYDEASFIYCMIADNLAYKSSEIRQLQEAIDMAYKRVECQQK